MGDCMKSEWKLIVAIGLLAMSMPVNAQNPSSHSSQDNGPDKRELQNTFAGLDPMWAELTISVATQKAKIGSQVTARLLQDVKANNKVVLDRGTKLIGHVTLVEAQTKAHTGSRLAIVFDKAIMRGESMPLQAFVQALVPPPQPLHQVDSNSTMNRDPTEGNFVLKTGGVVMTSLKGVFGLPGVSLTAPADHPLDTVFVSATHNIKLEDGSQMILKISQTAP